MSTEHDQLQAQRRMVSEEDMMALQQQFKEGKLQPSTKVVRAVRNKPLGQSSLTADSQTTATTTTDKEQERAQTSSASAREKDGASSSSSSSSSSVSASAAASTLESLVFPVAEGVAERQVKPVQPAAATTATPAQRPVIGPTSVGAARTGFPQAFRADLRAAAAPPATSTSTPAAAASGQPAKKKSLFAQQRDRMLAKQKEAAAAAASATAASSAAASAVVREVVSLGSDHAPIAPSQPTPSAPAAASSSPVPASSVSSSTISAPSRPLIPSIPESQGIHEENLVKLEGMSAEEIEQAQRDLMAQLPPELLALIRGGRGAAAAAAAPAPAPASSASASSAPLSDPTLPNESLPTRAQLNEYLLDEFQSHRGNVGHSSDSDSSDEEEDGIDATGAKVEQVSERMRLDQQLETFSARLESHRAIAAQKAKLEWSQPIAPSAPVQWPNTPAGYANDAAVWNSWRVDFEGRFIPHSSSSSQSSLKSEQKDDEKQSSSSPLDYDDPSNALYHHGDEADRPGYTMREILHLVRSSVAAQRTLNLQILAKVLAKIRMDEYEYPATVQPTPKAIETPDAKPNPIPPFSHLLFSHLLYLNLATLLRLSLDDNRNLAGIRETLTCFQNILYLPSAHLQPALDAAASFKGHELKRDYANQPLAANLEELDRAKKREEKRAEKLKNKKASLELDEDEDDEEEQKKKEAEEDDMNDNAADEELCSRDMVLGLLNMQLLDRMRYILEVHVLPALEYKANPPTLPAASRKGGAAATTIAMPTDATMGMAMLPPIVHILLVVAQHSPAAASKLFDTPRLNQLLAKTVSILTTIVAAGEKKSDSSTSTPSSLTLTSLSSSLHVLLLVIGCLCQLHRDIASFFLTHRSAPLASIKKLIVIPNGVPGLDTGAAAAAAEGGDVINDAEASLLLPLSIQALTLWRMCLAYGLDIESFMDHYPVLLGVLARTSHVVKRISLNKQGGVEGDEHGKVSALWLRQIGAVTLLVERLTLLFLPAHTSTSSLMPSVDSYSAPPGAISFEFAHVVQMVEQVLAKIGELWFVNTEPNTPPALVATLQETLAAMTHLLSSYYSVLPAQPSFDPTLTAIQVSKHTNMLFARTIDSDLFQRASSLLVDVQARGLDAVMDELGCGRPPLPFSNLPVSVPSNRDRPVQQALNVWFGLVRWQESLITHIPPAVAAQPGPNGAATKAQVDPAAIQAVREALARMLASSQAVRKQLLTHFYAPLPAACAKDGFNRVSSRTHLLTPLESELLVSLLVVERIDSSSTQVSSSHSTSDFYQRTLQLIPSLLRNGQQFLVSKLLVDVVFNGSMLEQMRKEGKHEACKECGLEAEAFPTRFSFAQCKLLHDLFAPFCYFREELLVSTLLHSSSLLTPTLCSPTASLSNLIANVETSTGGLLGAQLSFDGATTQASGCGAWLLNTIKHAKFLQVQLEKKGTNTKSHSILTMLHFLHAINSTLGLFTPPLPPASSDKPVVAHPMSTLFLRALMELYLQGSDVFLEPAFVSLLSHFLHQLLDAPEVVAASRARSTKLIGVANRAGSSLDMGASITHPDEGNKELERKLTEMMDQARGNKSAVAAASTAVAPAVPSSPPLPPAFHDFNSPSFPTSVWGNSFYPFFKTLIDTFVSDGMGDINFARLVLLMLRQEYATDHRIVIMRECREMMPSLDVEWVLDEEGYLFPYETNLEILQLLIAHLSDAPAMLTPQRNPRLYRVAIHHVAIHLFTWEHVSGQKEMSATDRVARVQSVMPMTVSPDVIRDLMNYQYEVKKEEAQSSEAQSESSGSSSAPVAGPTLSLEQLASIQQRRAEVLAPGLPVQEPGRKYGLVCPPCLKPNTLTSTFCTGCGFGLSPADLQRLPDNVFADLIHHRLPGGDAANGVQYRDETVVIVDDKFPTSDNHIDCLPVEMIVDISELTREHIPMLKKLHEKGRQVLLERNISWLPASASIDDLLTCGFNYPVSVPQLHLHMELPPYRHDRIFTYPRWHPYEKVMRDLEQHGRVILYNEQPNEQEGKETYDRAIRTHKQALQWIQEEE